MTGPELVTGKQSLYERDSEISKPQLKHVDLELTRECNLNCVHCSSGVDTKGDELSVFETKELLAEAKTLGLETVGLTGGEPLLRMEKLKEVVNFCRKELDVVIHLHSNGTRISREEADWLKRSEVYVTISLFGSEPRTHDAITNVEGSLGSTLSGLRNLVNAKAKLAAFVVPMRANVGEMSSIMDLIRREGVEDVRVLLPSPTGRAFHRFPEIELTNEQITDLRKELVQIRIRGIHVQGGFCTRLDLPDLEVLKGHERCYAAENRVHIDAFGNVYPCTASSGRRVFSAGNVLTCTLTEIWRFSSSFQFLRRFHSNAVTKCRRCSRFASCMSGCRVRMSYKYGDATIADPLCGGPFLPTSS